MAKHPKIFSHLYVSMVRAGEASGALDSVLVRLAEEGARPGVPELIEERIRDEDEPSVRVAAIQAVSNTI